MFVRSDSKTFRLLNGKCESHFQGKLNPRKFHWTVFFRRTHKKGSLEEAAKKRTRKTTKVQKAIAGVSLEQINAKRNQPVALRQTAITDAIKSAKEQKKKAAEEKKKAAKVDSKAAKTLQNKVSVKNVKTAKPKATSR